MAAPSRADLVAALNKHKAYGQSKGADSKWASGAGNEGYSNTDGDEFTAGDVSPKGDKDYFNTSGDESTAGDVSPKGSPCVDFDSSSGDESTADSVSPTGGGRDPSSRSCGGGSAADDVSPKDELNQPQGFPVAHQTAGQVTKEEMKVPQGIPVAHQTACHDTKEELREPQGIPVAHQIACQATKARTPEGGGPSPVQAAIHFAIAASGNPHVRPASSAEAQAEMLVPALTAVLGHLVALGCRRQRVTIFHATRVPQVNLADYLRRIARYYPCSDQGLVLGLIYLDRLMVKHPEFVVSGLSIHRLIATAMTLSSKFLNDISYKNEHYAKVAGLKAKELSFLEAHFLKLMDWRLNVKAEEFDLYLNNIMAAYPRGLITQGPAAPQVKRE